VNIQELPVVIPSLPHKDPDLKDDPNLSQRKADLERQKEIYQFGSVDGIVLVKDLPPQENFSIKYQLMKGKGVANLVANMLASRVENIFDPFDKLDDYEQLFPLLTKPITVHKWRSDTFFARQRLAGPNPMIIQGVDHLPELLKQFPVNNNLFQNAMGPDKTIKAEAAAGHLFLTDYAILHNLTLGSYQRGMKTVTAPKVLYCWRSRSLSGPGTLVPVAIQLYQDPGDNNPIYTPTDGMNWLMAKIFAQIADGNYHELVSHLGCTHLVMEVFALATATQLADSHPLSVLLKPHFQFTLAINTLAEGELISAGGYADRLLAGTLEASIGIIKRKYREWLDNFCDFAVPTELAKRNVGAERLQDYPYRDDALLLWQAIHTYVQKYLRLYYTEPADIKNDTELQGWVEQLMSPEGGGVKRLTPTGDLETLEQLVEVVTQVIFVCGPQHGAVNYSQYDYMAFCPNMPLAGYASPPAQEQKMEQHPEVDMDYILKLLPPQTQAATQLELMYFLTAFQFNRLGYPESGAISDAPALEVLKAFQQRLHEIEHEIDQRNKQRMEPYLFLKPSRVPNSLNI
jgi:arachidonate 15-lipoxygenase